MDYNSLAPCNKKVLRKPVWVRSVIPSGALFKEVNSTLAKYSLNTVCREAKCPNLGECWASKHATFLILGDECTRRCRFCSVKDKEAPRAISEDEPIRVAKAIHELNLKYVVVTSVTRDDLPLGGAEQFASTVRKIKEINPSVKVELLIPDFNGDKVALEKVIQAQPDVIGHNIETCLRLHEVIRPDGYYERSIEVLKYLKSNSTALVKSAFMVGLGERKEDIHEMIKDLKDGGIDILIIGQYLRPSSAHYPVQNFYEEKDFLHWKCEAEKLGIPLCLSGVKVRSSYQAMESYLQLLK